MRHGPVEGHSLPDVIVHAPPNFDARPPIHLVMFLHGLDSRPAWWVVSGDLAVVTGEQGVGWGLSARHDRARVNALLVAPQLVPHGAAGFSRVFHQPESLRVFVRELIEDTLSSRLGAGRTLADVASVTLVGSSASGPLIADLLARSDFVERVRTVVVIDGLYDGEGVFASWLRGSTSDAPRRFVCVHAGTRFTQPHAVELARRLRAQHTDLIEQPRHALADAVRDHAAVLAVADCDHGGMVFATYDKIVPSLGLPPRELDEAERRVPAHSTVPPGTPLMLGALMRGTLRREDARLRDWTYFDDWSLDLTALQRVRVDVRGGRTRGHLCARHDVEVSVLDGDRVLAFDDDGGGAMNARVELTAPHAGRYTVRVTERFPWGVEGEYSVLASATSP